MTAVTNTSSLKMRPWVTAALLAGLIIVGNSAGIAQARDHSVIVQYDASELATPQGSRALYLRIASAAQRVCGGRPDMTNPIAVAWSSACQKNAIEHAVQSIGNPMLAALHARQGGMLAYRAQSAL